MNDTRAPSVKAQGRGRPGRRDQVQQLRGPERQLGQRRRHQRAKEKEEKEARVVAAAEVMISNISPYELFPKYS